MARRIFTNLKVFWNYGIRLGNCWPRVKVQFLRWKFLEDDAKQGLLAPITWWPRNFCLGPDSYWRQQPRISVGAWGLVIIESILMLWWFYLCALVGLSKKMVIFHSFFTKQPFSTCFFSSGLKIFNACFDHLDKMPLVLHAEREYLVVKYYMPLSIGFS